MFRALTLISLPLVIAAIVIHAVIIRPRRAAETTAAPCPRRWEIAAYLLLLVGILMLALTGLSGVILHGPASLAGWKLWLHFASAPLFIIMLLLVVIAWGERSRFDTPADATPFSTGSRILFWLVAFCGFAALLTIVLSMAPIFSSDAQHTLYAIHRYAALFTVLAVIAHAYTLLLHRPPARESTHTTPAHTTTTVTHSEPAVR